MNRWLVIALAACCAVADAVEAPLRLQGDTVAVEAQIVDGAIRERYLARAGDVWIEVATAAPGLSAGPVEVVAVDQAAASCPSCPAPTVPSASITG